MDKSVCFRRTFFVQWRWGFRQAGVKLAAEGKGLTAELEAHQPLNGFALVGNDLRLPYQGNGNEAHEHNGKDENDDDVGLVNGEAEDAAKPSHGKGSPSTL